MKQFCNYQPRVIDWFSQPWETPVEPGLSVPPHCAGSCPTTVTVLSKTPLPPCRWQQATHKAWTSQKGPTGKYWSHREEDEWEGKARALPYPHNTYLLLVTLSSLSWASELQANLFPCCGSLQLSIHCLIGGGSMAATCICYLFVPISRCEAL